jgi:uncharacterized protein
MHIDLLPLQHSPSGTTRTLRVHRFGQPGARPKAYVQAALHADELPGVLVAHELIALLTEAEAKGELLGEVVVVPAANPVGLSQEFLGIHHGRFALSDGFNFNRGFADLSRGLAEALSRSSSQPGHDVSDDLRAHFLATVEQQKVNSESAALKAQLLTLAIDADVVLDLHCDGEAVMHLYTLPSLSTRIAPLARLLGAAVCLTATESGEGPFDEACSRPWQVAAATVPNAVLATPCLAATVELRGERDVSPVLAKQDARGIFEFLKVEGLVSGVLPTLPNHGYLVLPLAATEPVFAPASGVLIFESELGSTVAKGQVIARLVDPVSGLSTAVTAGTSGLLFARAASRWASAGKRMGKIAGSEVIRSGKLLSP